MITVERVEAPVRVIAYRAEERLAFSVERPAAFCVIDLTA